MCIFSGKVNSVGDTCIFMRERDDGKHVVVYKMVADLEHPVAMVLPVPVNIDLGDHAVAFYDLSHAPDFFTRLDKLFPAPPQPRSMRMSKILGATRSAPLKVHDVGAYEASYVPSIGDFGRLDARFRLDAGIWGQLPDYRRYGFAVFQLRRIHAGSGRDKFHPMAFDYQPENPRRLFFPTMHVHDGGDVPDTADYDHTLYMQAGGQFPNANLKMWQANRDDPGTRLIADTSNIISPVGELFRMRIRGSMPNQDIMVNSDGALVYQGAQENIPDAMEEAPIGTISRYCTSCGHLRELNHKFCGGCGVQLP